MKKIIRFAVVLAYTFVAAAALTLCDNFKLGFAIACLCCIHAVLVWDAA